MESIDPKMLSKIKKCLALAGSDNPHEAAAAMRQAKALMEKYGVSANHITMAEIGEAAAKSATMSRDKPANWEMHLAGIVGKTFGCKMMVCRNLYETGNGYANEGSYVFVGLKQQAEVASYTASVLIRKCKKARALYISENLRGLSALGRGRKTKATRLGDTFAVGWVIAIAKLVSEFANPPDIDAAIEQYIDAETDGKEAKLRDVKRGEIGQLELRAAQAGILAASGESLHRPMSKNIDALLIS